MRRTTNLVLISTILVFATGCLLVRDRTFVRNPDGTMTQVAEQVKVDPDNPLGSLPYGPIAVSLMGLGAAVYNEVQKRRIDKKYVATVKGVDAVLATMPSGAESAKSLLRDVHMSAGVYDQVKADLKKVRA